MGYDVVEISAWLPRVFRLADTPSFEFYGSDRRSPWLENAVNVAVNTRVEIGESRSRLAEDVETTSRTPLTNAGSTEEQKPDSDLVCSSRYPRISQVNCVVVCGVQFPGLLIKCVGGCWCQRVYRCNQENYQASFGDASGLTVDVADMWLHNCGVVLLSTCTSLAHRIMNPCLESSRTSVCRQ
jgi:hypothetical protein